MRARGALSEAERVGGCVCVAQRGRRVWAGRQVLPQWGARITDAKVRSALQVCGQTLMMMTELQADGLRVLKGPLHYCE